MSSTPISSLPNNVLAASKSPTPNPDKVIYAFHSIHYPHRVWFCIAGVILFVTLCRFTTVLCNTRSGMQTPTRPRTRGVVQYRRLPAAILNAVRAIVFRWTIPIGNSYTLNLAEVFLTAAYITIVFAWALFNSTDLAGHRFNPKYWANLTGIIAASQFPLITALGTKNNVIALLTGVNMEKVVIIDISSLQYSSLDQMQLNYLHRAYARVLVILIWLHAGGRLKLGLKDDTGVHMTYIQCGFVAATSLSLLSIISLRPLRKRNYEIFLVIHFILVMTILLAAHFHTEGFKAFRNYVWPSFVIWGVDRFVRLFRVLVFNTTILQGRLRTVTDAHVENLSPSLLRITLPRPTHWSIRWKGGQNAYLSVVPSVAAWRLLGYVSFEAHPFTIASVDHTRAKPSNDGYKPDIAAEKENNEKNLVFFVRVRNGFTKRLMRAVQDQYLDMKFVIDGPYGTTPHLQAYETVVFIGGGSGISFTFPLLLDLISRTKREKSACTRIVFVWAIREADSVSWIADDLVLALRDIPSTCVIDVGIYITGSQDDVGDPLEAVRTLPHGEPTSPDIEKKLQVGNESSSIKSAGPGPTEIPGVNVKFGRPDVQGILEQEIKNGQPNGEISVNVCGGQEMNRAVKEALSPVRFLDILKGAPSVSLHVESYGDM